MKEKKEIKIIISEKIYPHKLNESEELAISKLIDKYSYEDLVECVEISAKRYLKYTDKKTIIESSVKEFLNKLGGVAYNKSLDPIKSEINHMKNICKKNIKTNWDDSKAENLLMKYVDGLKKSGFDEKRITYNLQTKIKRLCKSSKKWSNWKSILEYLIDEIGHSEKCDTIQHNESIVPISILDGSPKDVETLCQQVNASYKHCIYDGTAVLMRKLLEVLLIYFYENKKIQQKIQDKDGRYYNLDKIIKDAEQNSDLSIPTDIKDSLRFFKEIGNNAAHKRFYITKKEDIEPKIFKYRTIVQQLINLADFNKNHRKIDSEGFSNSYCKRYF